MGQALQKQKKSSSRARVLKKQEHFTYDDYKDWSEDIRYELLEGVPFLLAAPSTTHQEAAGVIYASLRTSLKDKKCRAFIAPTDVRLNADDADDTVLQPDVFVVCDPKKISKACITGAPDFVVEVISESTKSYDLGKKLDLYLEAGVKEVWNVHADDRVIVTFCSSEGEGGRANAFTTIYGASDKVPVSALPGVEIDMAEVFADIPITSPKIEES